MTLLNWPKWSSRQWVLFMPLAAAFVILPLYFRDPMGITLSDSLLWLTGVVLLIYTVETHGLRIEMVRQNEIAVQPVIVAAAKKGESETVEFLLKNIGRGPALFVKVDGALLTRELGENWLVTRTNAIDYIEPGCEITAAALGKRDRQGVSPIKKKGEQPFHMTIQYEDINGTKIETVLQVGIGQQLLKYGLPN